MGYEENQCFWIGNLFKTFAINSFDDKSQDKYEVKLISEVIPSFDETLFPYWQTNELILTCSSVKQHIEMGMMTDRQISIARFKSCQFLFYFLARIAHMSACFPPIGASKPTRDLPRDSKLVGSP